MRWLSDECVDAGLVSRLRVAGHDVSYTAEMSSGASDVDVLRQAQAETRLLLTEDKGFGDLVFRLKLPVPWGRAAAPRSRKAPGKMEPLGGCHRQIWGEVIWALW